MGEASRKKHLLITAVLILVLAPCAFSRLYGCFLERETSAYLAAVNARWQLELPTTVCEMEVFTQFASDLDDATKAQLQHGKALMELLKQG